MDKKELLRVRGLEARYGTIRVLQGLDMSVGSHPLAVVGRNGMGKSTLCYSIMGMGPICNGSISFNGVELIGRPSHQIARQGVALVPQGRRIFGSLTVEEHLRLAESSGARKWNRERVYSVFPRLFERKLAMGGSLSGGEQQMLAIARALLTNPLLLVMDEPSEGLAPVVVDQLIATLKTLLSEGTSLLLVEQNLSVATAVSERLAVMLAGRIVLETTSRELLANSEMQQRLLGIGAAEGFEKTPSGNL